MECGKLTAKLRDAVPVCFIENGKEIKRFKNIEIPDEIKKLPYQDFEFSVPVTGAITFKIMFEPGTLPDTWPEPRQRKSRTPKAADPEPMPEEPAQDAVEAISDALAQAQEEGQPVDEIAQVAADGAEITTEIIEAEDGGHEIIITAEDEPDDEQLPETMENSLRRTRQRPQGPGQRHRRDHRHIPQLSGRSQLRLHHWRIHSGSERRIEWPAQFPADADAGSGRIPHQVKRTTTIPA